MASSIRLKHSSTKDKKPTAGDLENGELALNINADSPGAFIKDSDGNVVSLTDGTNVEGYPDLNDGKGSTLDARYVNKVVGDNMTGNLTLGTDKITLDASDGSATFAGSLQATTEIAVDSTGDSAFRWQENGTDVYSLYNNSTSDTLTIYDNVGDKPLVDFYPSGKVGFNVNKVTIEPDGSAFFAGDIGIGGTEASPNIELKSSDGSAEFSGEVRVDPDNNAALYVGDKQALEARPQADGKDGVRLFGTSVSVSRSNAGVVFQGRQVDLVGPGSNDFTSIINGDGSAEFNGKGTFKDDLRVQDGGNFRVRNANNASQDAVLLKNDGSGTFASDVKIGGTEASPNIELKGSDGTGTFDGSVISGFPNEEGLIRVFGGGYSDQKTNVFTGSGTGGTITSSIKADGSADFFGIVDGLQFVAKQTGGGFVASRVSDGLQVWRAGSTDFDISDPDTYTSEILSDGSATFDGQVTSGTSTGAANTSGASLGADGFVTVNHSTRQTLSCLAVIDTVAAKKTVDILGNGSASFSTSMRSGTMPGSGTGTYVQCDRTDGFTVVNANVTKAKITMEGSAEFDGDLGIGFYGQFGAGFSGSGLENNGGFVTYKDYGSSVANTVKVIDINSAGVDVSGVYSNKISMYADGSADFVGDVTANNVTFNLEPDNEANYTTTTEEYTEIETYEIEVPVIQTGVGTADLVDGDEQETRTVTREREVTKTHEVKEYVGPVLDVKETLLKLTGALESLKTAAASATTCEELRTAIETALADV